MSVDNYLYCLDCNIYYHYGQRNHIYASTEELQSFTKFLEEHTNHLLTKQDNDCGGLQTISENTPIKNVLARQINYLGNY